VGLDDGADADSVDGAGDVVLWLGAPDLVGVERDRHEHPASAARGEGRGEALRLHGSILPQQLDLLRAVTGPGP
jgi:hypothetical protein